MPIIGTFKKTDDTYTGTIRTLTLDIPASIVTNPRNGNDKAPDYRIHGNDNAELGAAWKETSKAGQEFLKVKLDCPALPKAVFACLINQDGKYTLVWKR